MTYTDCTISEFYKDSAISVTRDSPWVDWYCIVTDKFGFITTEGWMKDSARLSKFKARARARNIVRHPRTADL